MTDPPPDHLEQAVEHIAWCIRQKMNPTDVFRSVGRYRDDPTWNDAILLIATLDQEMVENVRSIRTCRYRTPVFPPAPPKVVHRRAV